MTSIWILFKTQFYQYFRVNNWSHSRDNRNRNATLITSLAILFVIVFLLVYNLITVLTLVRMGQERQILSYMTSMASFISFFLTIFQANDLLFFGRDREMLTVLPLHTRTILFNKFLFLYFFNLAILFLFVFPALIIWTFNGGLIVSSFLYFLSILFLPILPLVLGAFFAFATLYFSSLFKGRPWLTVLLSLGLMGLFLTWVTANMRTGQETGDLGFLLAKQISALYPLAFIFETNLGQLNFPYLILYDIFSFLLGLVFISLVSRRSVSRSHSFSQTTPSRGRLQYAKSKSIFSALYLKEWHHYQSSYILMLNTCLGILLLLIYSLAILLLPSEQIADTLGLPNVSSFITSFAPLLITAFLSMSVTTTSSLSLEGREVWILKSLPIGIKQIIKSKIFFNLTLHSLGYIPAVLIIAIKYPMNVIHLIFLLLIPLVSSLFISISGLYLNTRYPNYHWETESFVIKQSLPVILAGLINFFIILPPLAAILFFQTNLFLTYSTLLSVLGLLTLFFYRKLLSIKYI